MQEKLDILNEISEEMYDDIESIQEWIGEHESEGFENGNEFEKQIKVINEQLVELDSRINLVTEAILVVNKRLDYVHDRIDRVHEI